VLPPPISTTTALSFETISGNPPTAPQKDSLASRLPEIISKGSPVFLFISSINSLPSMASLIALVATPNTFSTLKFSRICLHSKIAERVLSLAVSFNLPRSFNSSPILVIFVYLFNTLRVFPGFVSATSIRTELVPKSKLAYIATMIHLKFINDPFIITAEISQIEKAPKWCLIIAFSASTAFRVGITFYILLPLITFLHKLCQLIFK